MPERARTDLWEPQGSNPLGPPGPELKTRPEALADRKQAHEERKPRRAGSVSIPGEPDCVHASVWTDIGRGWKAASEMVKSS